MFHGIRALCENIGKALNVESEGRMDTRDNRKSK
jgi:hypothetical protein